MGEYEAAAEAQDAIVRHVLDHASYHQTRYPDERCKSHRPAHKH
jgi:hypothetical protein